MIFNETVKWKCLGRFFEEPEMEYYVNELARELKISSGSASQTCKELKAEGMLQSKEKGRALFYSLKNDEPVVRRLKSAWFLNQLTKFRECWESQENQSVVLYGSRASGEFISRSDVDMLVLTNVAQERIERDFWGVRKEFGSELMLTVMPIAKWKEMADRKDRFYVEVLANHILLYGSSLVIG